MTANETMTEAERADFMRSFLMDMLTNHPGTRSLTWYEDRVAKLDILALSIVFIPVHGYLRADYVGARVFEAVLTPGNDMLLRNYDDTYFDKVEDVYRD